MSQIEDVQANSRQLKIYLVPSTFHRAHGRTRSAPETYFGKRIRARVPNAEVEDNLLKRNATRLSFCGLLFVLAIGSDRLMAQAPPGPLPVPPQTNVPRPRPATRPKPPEVPPRTSLDGAWKFNRDESDDTQRKIQDSRGTSANSGGGRNGGGYPGGGYPGGGGYPPGVGFPGGGYPRGGPPDGGNKRETETDERLEDLIRPPSSLSFTIKNPEIDLTDDHFRKLAFFTDGRQLQKPKDDSYQEIAARWDGKLLVTDEKTPQGAKMSRTFELSSNGRQFFETVHVDRGKSKGQLVIRYVYDVAASGTEADHESDPDQPVLRRHPDSGNSTSNPQGAPSGQGSDPDQPTMRKRPDDGSNPPQ